MTKRQTFTVQRFFAFEFFSLTNEMAKGTKINKQNYFKLMLITNTERNMIFFLIRIVMCSGFGLWGQIPLSTRRGDGVSWLTGSETWNLVEDVFTPIPSTSHARRLSRITIGEGIEAYLSKVGFEIQLRITSFLPFRIHEIAVLTCML